jgi:signal transduction histidine kinase
MRRLYRKIYLTTIASLLMVVLIGGALWRLGSDASPARQAFEIAGGLAAAALPPADAPATLQRKALEEIAKRLKTDLALFDSALKPIAAVGRPLPVPRGRESGGWLYGFKGAAWSARLPDGRWVVVRAPPRQWHPALALVTFLGAIALAVAVCAYPVVRGLTRRLERLQTGVETLGGGNLGARVKVEGRDEIARLAESFNRAAARIEELVGAHRMLLANASHELRTPLSRIRLGLELWQQQGDPKHKAAVERDIAELDFLIDEILLASRLDATPALGIREEVDLLALAAEECARYEGCSVQGPSMLVQGEARLLRRLVRNLLENAARHGRPPIRVELHRKGPIGFLDVIDAGQGVPESEREHIFTPFHRLGGEAKGSGLGLPLVRQIARLHGGDAIVAPGVKDASRFRVVLPVASSGAAETS